MDIYTISKIDINRYLHPKHKSNYALMLKSLSNSHVSLFAGGIPVLWQQKTPKTSSFACIFPCRNFIGSQSDYYLTVVILKVQWKLSNRNSCKRTAPRTAAFTKFCFNSHSYTNSVFIHFRKWPRILWGLMIWTFPLFAQVSRHQIKNPM